MDGRLVGALLGALTLRCASTEGTVLGRLDAGDAGPAAGGDAALDTDAASGADAALGCPPAATLTEGPDVNLGNVVEHGTTASIAYDTGNDAWLLDVDARGLPTGAPLALAGSGYVFGGVLGAGSVTSGCMLFQDHALSGQWRVYAGPFTSTGLDLGALATVSNGTTESVGPRVVSGAGGLAVAFRQDSALAFARVSAGCQVTSRVTLPPAAGTLPLVVRVAATSSRYAVLDKRDSFELSWFTLAGDFSAPGPTSTADAADVVADGASALVARAVGLAMSVEPVVADDAATGPPRTTWTARANVAAVATSPSRCAVRDVDGHVVVRDLASGVEQEVTTTALAGPELSSSFVVWIEKSPAGRALRTRQICLR